MRQSKWWYVGSLGWTVAAGFLFAAYAAGGGGMLFFYLGRRDAG